MGGGGGHGRVLFTPLSVPFILPCTSKKCIFTYAPLTFTRRCPPVTEPMDKPFGRVSSSL